MVWLWIPSGLFQVAPETIKGSRNQPINNNNSKQSVQQLPTRHFVLEIRKTAHQQPSAAASQKEYHGSEYIVCDGASWVSPSLFPFAVLGHTHPAQPSSSGSGTRATTLCILEDRVDNGSTTSPSPPKVNIATRMTSSRIKSWIQQSEWRTLVMDCGCEEGIGEVTPSLASLENSLLQGSPSSVGQGVRLFTPGAASSTQMYLHVPPPPTLTTSATTAVFRVTLDPIPRSTVDSLFLSTSTAPSTTFNQKSSSKTQSCGDQHEHLFTRVNTAIETSSSNSIATNSLHPALLTRDPQSHIKACILGAAVIPGAYVAVPDESSSQGDGHGGGVYYFRVASVEKKKVQSSGVGSTSFEATTQLAAISPSTVLRLNLSSRAAALTSSSESDGQNKQDTAPKVVVGLETQQHQCVQLIRRAIHDAQAAQRTGKQQDDDDSFTSSSHSQPPQLVPPTTATILLAGPSGCGKHSLLSSALQQATHDYELNSAVVDTIHVNWGLGESVATETKNPLASALQSAGSSGDVSAKRIAETLSSKSVPTTLKRGTSASSSSQSVCCPVIICVLNIANAALEFPPDDSRLTRMNQERLTRGIATIEAALRQTVENGVARSTIAWPHNDAGDGTPMIGFVFVVAAFAESVRAVHQLATSATFNNGIISTPMSVTSTTTNPTMSQKKALCVASGVCEVPLPGLAQRERLVAQSFSTTLSSTTLLERPQYQRELLAIISRLGVHGARAAARYLMGASGRDCVRVGDYLYEYLTQGLLVGGTYWDFAQRARQMFSIKTTVEIHDTPLGKTTDAPNGIDAVLANLVGLPSPALPQQPVAGAEPSMALSESISAKMAPLMVRLIRTPGLLHGTLSNGGGLPEEGSTGGTSWDDIGGLVEVKDRLRQALIRPRLHPEAYKRFNITPPRGILLYGPPGCAKTTLVKALCNEGLYSFIYVDCASVLSSYVGESEQFLRDVFAKGRAQAPCIVFFDEVEGVSGNRAPSSGGGSDSARLLSTLLIEIDGFAGGGDGDDSGSSDAHVCFVGATNLPQLVDPALLRPGRFDYLVYVPLPSASERYSIMRSVLQRGHRRGAIHSPSQQQTLLDDDVISDLMTDTSKCSLMGLEILVQQYADCVLDPSSVGFFTTAASAVEEDFVSSLLLLLPTDFAELEVIANKKHSAMEALLAELSTSGDKRQLLLIAALRASAAETLVSLCENATDGFSGADLTSLIKEAAAIRQRHSSTTTITTTADGSAPDSRCSHITLRDIETATLKVSPVDFDTTAMENFRETH